jgi:hypothetical protein
MSTAIQVVANGNKEMKLMMSFMTKEEKAVRNAFR